MDDNDWEQLDFVIAALGRTSIIALPCKVGNTALTLAIDTGATVNVISHSTYRSLTRQAEGGNWPLQENDLNVVGVTGTALGFLGRVSLTVSLHKKVCPFRDIYVSEKIALPVEGILGLNAMKDMHITINPENHAIVYQGRRIHGMVNPSPKVTPSEVENDQFTTESGSSTAQVSPLTVKPHETASDSWQTVTSVVEGTQIVPDRPAKIVKIRIPNAPTSSDVCIECAPHIHLVTVEVTLVTVKEGGIA